MAAAARLSGTLSPDRIVLQRELRENSSGTQVTGTTQWVKRSFTRVRVRLPPGRLARARGREEAALADYSLPAEAAPADYALGGRDGDTCSENEFNEDKDRKPSVAQCSKPLARSSQLSTDNNDGNKVTTRSSTTSSTSATTQVTFTCGSTLTTQCKHGTTYTLGGLTGRRCYSLVVCANVHFIVETKNGRFFRLNAFLGNGNCDLNSEL